MTKKIMTMFLLLAVAVGLYARTAKVKHDGELMPTQTAKPSQTATLQTCQIKTGIDGGLVNLRACASVSCTVMDVVTEGERLTIHTAGAWMNVTSTNGVTGYINSKYCKGK